MLSKKVLIDNNSSISLSFLYLANTSSLICLYNSQSSIHGIALASTKSFPLRILLLSINLIILFNPTANFSQLII